MFFRNYKSSESPRRSRPGFRSPRLDALFQHSTTHAVVLAVLLWLAVPDDAMAETTLHYKWEDYREQSDRIRVKAQYLRAEVGIGEATKLSVEGVEDVITGATPTGQPAPEGSDQVPLSQLIETRYAVVADVARTFANSTVSLEYARSNENDYLSDGYSMTWAQDFNQKNTQLQFGFSYIDDDITPDFFAEKERKLSRDFLVGVTQVLGPNTTLAVNYTHGHSTGFMNDPYKLVQKTVELLPGLSLPLTYSENRPDVRNKDILFAQLMHYFENLRASVESSARYYRDNHGIDSGTLELAWHQRIGPRVVVRPNVRFYRQSAADYYHYNLDNTNIEPVIEPDATAPFYSSDYRLARFDATTFGLKLVYNHDDRWSFDALFERYSMHGRDDTPDSAFITANTITLGAKLWF